MKNDQYFFQQKLEELLARLREAELREADFIKRMNICIQFCIDFISMAQRAVVQDGFADPPGEVYFFKHVKPMVVARYKFYHRICRMHLGGWKGAPAWTEERLVKEMEAVELVFRCNSSLWEYYQSGSTYMDEQYFVRGHQHWLLLGGHAGFDALFATPCDGALADLLAEELYSEYIGKRIAGDNDPVIGNRRPAETYNLICTAPKAHVTVLGYSLHYVNFFDNGQATKNKVMNGLQHQWNIDLRNHSQMIDQVMRQHEPDRFLRDLLDGFNGFLRSKGR